MILRFYNTPDYIAINTSAETWTNNPKIANKPDTMRLCNPTDYTNLLEEIRFNCYQYAETETEFYNGVIPELIPF